METLLLYVIMGIFHILIGVSRLLKTVLQFTGHYFGRLLCLQIAVLFLVSCSMLSTKSKDLWKEGDFDAPKILALTQTSQTNITIQLTEAVNLLQGYVRLYALDFSSSVLNLETQDQIEIQIEEKGLTLLVTTSDNLRKGHPYVIEAHLFDIHGNSVTLVLDFYGKNDTLPVALINEVITEGTKTNGDKIELVFLSGGNIAGMSIQEGGIDTYSVRIILPEINVEKGDFLIIHLRPNPELSTSIFESSSKEEITLARTSPEAWDYLVKENKSIPNSNGIIVLKQNPYGTVLDTLIYTTRSNAPDKVERGFTNLQFAETVDELAKQQQWLSNESHMSLVPSDMINPKDSTTTRSIARSSDSGDTNKKTDWHITPTGGASFGTINTDEAYVPTQ